MENNFLIEKLDQCVKQYWTKPHVDLVLENISAFDGQGLEQFFICQMQHVIVGVLNEITPNRIYTLMDTCHMMMSIEAFSRITNGIKKITNWDEQFKQQMLM